jgi:hypothetical protein
MTSIHLQSNFILDIVSMPDRKITSAPRVILALQVKIPYQLHSSRIVCLFHIESVAVPVSDLFPGLLLFEFFQLVAILFT